MHRCTLIQRGRLQARSRPGDKHIRTDNVVYSSWFASESEEAPPSDKWSAPCVLSCSDSCSLVGMEFFFGRPLGLVGDSSPPPCNTFEAATIHISLDVHMYHNFYAKYNLNKCVPVAQCLEHCVSSAKVVGSIPREHIY